MARKTYVRCSVCDVVDAPRRGKLVNVGTSTAMRCEDCGGTDPSHPEGRAAIYCRACCPTGHATHGEADVDPRGADSAAWDAAAARGFTIGETTSQRLNGSDVTVWPIRAGGIELGTVAYVRSGLLRWLTFYANGRDCDGTATAGTAVAALEGGE